MSSSCSSFVHCFLPSVLYTLFSVTLFMFGRFPRSLAEFVESLLGPALTIKSSCLLLLFNFFIITFRNGGCIKRRIILLRQYKPLWIVDNLTQADDSAVDFSRFFRRR